MLLTEGTTVGDNVWEAEMAPVEMVSEMELLTVGATEVAVEDKVSGTATAPEEIP